MGTREVKEHSLKFQELEHKMEQQHRSLVAQLDKWSSNIMTMIKGPAVGEAASYANVLNGRPASFGDLLQQQPPIYSNGGQPQLLTPPQQLNPYSGQRCRKVGPAWLYKFSLDTCLLRSQAEVVP